MENGRACDRSNENRIGEIERFLRDSDSNIVCLQYLATERNMQGILCFIFYALYKDGNKYGLIIGDTPVGLQLYKRGIADCRISV